MIEEIIQLVTILFLLSMVSERIADFLKHNLSDSYLFRIKLKFFKIGDTTTKYPADDLRENERAFRILKINIWCGIIIATILKADLIKIFNHIEKAGETLGWNTISLYASDKEHWYQSVDYYFLIPGIILTGCFISFGSKFWHDSLDILYQIKNAKRILADPETYKIDNIENLKNIYNTYQSDFIKSAFLEARTKFMAMDSVKAIAIKSDENEYYFELTVNEYDPAIGLNYQYVMNEGIVQNIPIRIVKMHIDDKIVAHAIDLSAQVYDVDHPKNWGTLGVLVKSTNEDSGKRYLLTCCHNVVKPFSKLPYAQAGEVLITAGTFEKEKKIELGIVFRAEKDHEVDAALIELNPEILSELRNYIPQIGIPQQARVLYESDKDLVRAYLFGAKSGVVAGRTEGIVTSIYNDIKITYNSNEEFTIINTIGISNEGRAISQPGDSGACVVDSNNNILGIVVAGNSKTTYILPIKTLLTKLNVQIA